MRDCRPQRYQGCRPGVAPLLTSPHWQLCMIEHPHQPSLRRDRAWGDLGRSRWSRISPAIAPSRQSLGRVRRIDVALRFWSAVGTGQLALGGSWHLVLGRQQAEGNGEGRADEGHPHHRDRSGDAHKEVLKVQLCSWDGWERGRVSGEAKQR